MEKNFTMTIKQIRIQSNPIGMGMGSVISVILLLLFVVYFDAIFFWVIMFSFDCRNLW